MSYVEWGAPTPSDVVACLWRQDVDADEQVVLPDGCIDVVWFGSGRLVVAGADTRVMTETLTPGDTASGVRLAPGAAAAALGRDVAELRDRRVDAVEVWGRRADAVTDALATADDPHAVLLGALVDDEPDRLVGAAARLVSEPHARVDDVAWTLGVSERQLHRRCVASIGYGPKTLARVMRLRRLQTLAGVDLAEAALTAGYASQAHMGDEVRRLAGTTPARLLAA